MNVTLNPELEETIRLKVQRGDYKDTTSLIEEAVHRLVQEEQEEEIHQVRQRLAQADAEIDRGECLTITVDTLQNFAQNIHQRGLKKLTDRPKSDPRE